MSVLWSDIKAAVAADAWIVSAHAASRLRQRRVRAWQVSAGIDGVRLLRVREDSEPNPTVEVLTHMPDGASLVCVWAWLADDRSALLVTVYFPDRA